MSEPEPQPEPEPADDESFYRILSYEPPQPPRVYRGDGRCYGYDDDPV